MLWHLWHDEAGGVSSAEILLVLTLLVIGLVAGFDIHDAILEDLADIAQACADVNQSFDYGGTSSGSAETAGSAFTDRADFCDGPNGVQNSKCVVICTSALSEGGT